MSKSSKSTAASSYHHGDLRQALIDAGLAIVTEEQNWGFSLREVARRAGVSHNAPYNHFAEKRDLLDAVAAVGFDKLQAVMVSALEGSNEADIRILALARAYVSFAVGNPALYRLMFGPELAGQDGARPALTEAAGAGAKAILLGVVVQGAKDGVFAVSAEDENAIALAALFTWSAVHGLSMLIVDGKAGTTVGTDLLASGILTIVLEGLRRR